MFFVVLRTYIVLWYFTLLVDRGKIKFLFSGATFD